MPDYSKGKIYRLTCNDPELIYYGSTTLTLPQRLTVHKTKIGDCSSKKLFEVGGVEIELVLNCPCNSSKELREVEQTYIDNDKCINESNAVFNKEQYEKSEKRINSRKIAELKYRETDKYKKNQKIRKQSEEYKKKDRESKKIKRQDYNFTKDIFEE